MHELSIAHAVVEVVTAAAHGHGARRVTALTVRVGALSGVVPDALRFCFDVVAAGTTAAGATLVVERAPVTVWCPDCAVVQTLADGPGGAIVFRCPTCGRRTGDVRGGRELDLVRFTCDDDGDDGGGGDDAAAVAPAAGDVA